MQGEYTGDAQENGMKKTFCNATGATVQFCADTKQWQLSANGGSHRYSSSTNAHRDVPWGTNRKMEAPHWENQRE